MPCEHGQRLRVLATGTLGWLTGGIRHMEDESWSWGQGASPPSDTNPKYTGSGASGPRPRVLLCRFAHRVQQ
jgi:hypothetical protein